MIYIFLTGVFFILCLFFYMLVLAFQVNVKEHKLHITKMNDGEQLNIFFISDIHRRKISDTLIHSVIGKVDIVIVGGDLTEKGVPLKRTEHNIKQLNKLGKVYYVYGNNDREVGEQMLQSILKKHDVCILVNNLVELRIEKSFVRLVGINDGFDGKVKLYEAFEEVQEEDIIIFVSHAPAFFYNAKKVSNPHLLLAGHLHGGQIRFGRFGIYENGSFKINENHGELISNGYGTTGVPLRLGAKSECHIITMHG